MHASPDVVIHAFLEIPAMCRWWAVERGLVDAREGGVWALAWDRSEHGFRYFTTGRIASIEPGRSLHIDNLAYFSPDRPVLGPMALTITITPQGRNSQVTIRQDGYQDGNDWDWYYQAVREAWPKGAQQVKQFVEMP